MAKAPDTTAATDELEASTSRALVAAQDTGFEIDSSLAVQLSRAEIDVAVATAHQYPRSMAQAIRNAISLATNDTATATECIYSLPRDGKAIVGPSIRLAELVAQQWGNNRFYARVTAIDRKEGYIEAEGIYQDLETNSTVGKKVRRRITDKRGKLFNADMIGVTGNAACSIALRNAILAGIPRPIWRQAFERAQAAVRGDEKTLGTRRVALIEAFKALNVAPADVFRLGGIKGVEDIGLDEIVVLSGLYASIKNGEATVQDLLRQSGPAAPPPGKTLAAAFEQAKPGDTIPVEETATIYDAETGEVLDNVVKGDAIHVVEEPTVEPEVAAEEPEQTIVTEAAVGEETEGVFARCNTWPEVSTTLGAILRGDPKLSPEEAAECQWQALERAMAIIEAGNAEHTPQNHPTLFRLWAMREKASNPAAIRPAYRALTKSPAFAAADQTTQDALALIVTEAEAAQ